MQNKYTIRLETTSDYKEAEHLTREAFWNVYRPGCLEHYVLHTFRSNPDFVPELDLVMERDGKLIGHGWVKQMIIETQTPVKWRPCTVQRNLAAAKS